MPTQPPFLTGSGVNGYTLTLVGQSVSASGVLSAITGAAGASRAFTGKLDENSIQINYDADVENIQAADGILQNFVIIEKGTSLTFNEILMRNDAAYPNDTNFLARIASACDVVAYTVTRGTRVWAGYGVIQRYDESLNKRKSIGSLTLVPIDPGQANPSYT